MLELYTNRDNTVTTKIDTDEFGVMRLRREMYVPPEIIDECRAEFEASKAVPAGDGFGRGRLWCIPSDLLFDWLREGFDPNAVEPREVAARLRSEGLEYLICNAKL